MSVIVFKKKQHMQYYIVFHVTLTLDTLTFIVSSACMS